MCPGEPKVSACCVFWAPFIPPGELLPGKLNQCGEVWCCVHTRVFSCRCSLSAIFLNTLFLFFLSNCSVGCCHDSLLPANHAQPHVMVTGTYFSSLGACTLVSVPCCTGFCYIWTVTGGFLHFIYLVLLVVCCGRCTEAAMYVLRYFTVSLFFLKANMCKYVESSLEVLGQDV